MQRFPRFNRPRIRGNASSALLGYIDGDGSTLSLDFTTGVLDQRLALTRSTNATFINSQGYVEWAAANALSNSVFDGASGATQPSGWLVSFVGGTGSFTLNGTELTISNNGSATRSRIYQTGPTGNGLPVTVQLKVVANNTSGMALVELLGFSIAGASSVVYKVNGTNQLSSFSGWVAGDTVTLTCIPTAGSAATCLFGLGVSAPVSTSASVTIKDVQIEPGSVARSYIATTTSGAYQAPRFDYDPTTTPPTPRGLLIEASANNLFYWSESFETSGAANNWNFSALNTTRGTVTTTNPAGISTTVVKIQETSAAGLHAPLIVYSSVTSSVYTISAFVQAAERQYIQLIDNGGSGAFGMFNLSGSGSVVSESAVGVSTITEYPNNWYRIVVRTPTLTNIKVQFRLSTDGTTTSYTGTTGSGVYIWGAQLEAGSGASSYIPTGTSQGNRAADFAVWSDLSAVAFNTAGGSMVMRGYQTKLSSGSFPALAAFLDSGDVDVFGFRNDVAGAVMFGRFAGTSTSAEATRTITNNAPYAIGMSADPTITTGAIIVSMNGSSTTANKSGSATAISAPAKFALTRPGYALYINCGAISSIKYWPTVKTAAELNSLTTG